MNGSPNLDCPKCTKLKMENTSCPNCNADLAYFHNATCVGCSKLKLNLITQNPIPQLPFFPPI